ncbi:hypothetical protein UPYG_G00105920 [Umbra pygmaea]|uniref:SAM domain-containing protein n=1 Tax=Umbra pygmaea TaxID=75934 RepID=A0ABD0X1W4_UMBPY
MTSTATCAQTTTTASTTIRTSTPLYQDRNHPAPSGSTTTSRRIGEHHQHPPAKVGESQETVVDSGIEELDSRSSSDHHLDSIMTLSGGARERLGERLERGREGGGMGGGEGDRAGGADLLESYMSYLDGQTFDMHNATASTYPKSGRFREGGRAAELRRETSTAPPSFHSHRRREEEEEMEEGEVGEEEDSGGRDGYGMSQDLGRPTSPYFDRPRTPEMKPLWGSDSQLVDQGAYTEGRKLYPPMSSMKASIINELNNKLQQRGSQRSLSRNSLSTTRNRFSEDSASALSPPSARSLSPSPIHLSQPALSPSPTPSSQYASWARSPSPQPPVAAVQPPPRSHSPLSSPTYSPYPTSPKRRPVYRTKALEFQFIPSRESRKAESHHMQRRRAPSPLISPSERPKLGPPRPSSLPLLPTSPFYSSLYELRGSITPPSPANPLGDPYFSPSAPLFAPSGAPPPPNASPVGPFASKPLPYWTKYDVADWLGYLNLGEHRERFLDNEIDGTHLPSLTKEDYLDLGVTRVGHRMNIERALKRVTDRLASSPFPISALSPRGRRDDGSRS